VNQLNNAADHAGGEVLLDAIGGGRRRGTQKSCLELLAMGVVVHPAARNGDPFTGRDGCSVPNDGDDVPMSAHFGTQDAEAIFNVVVSNALDQARQNFLI
jgi:hypothetical protein